MKPDFRFERGLAYVGTATGDRSRKKIFVVTDRRGGTVSFSHVHKVCREQVDDCFGTEVARIRDRDGLDYFASARIPVDVDEAFRIVELCEGRRPHETRGGRP